MEIFQLLGPDGELRDDPATEAVDPDLCRALFRDMFLARRFDQEAYHLQRQGELGLWLQSRGRSHGTEPPRGRGRTGRPSRARAARG